MAQPTPRTRSFAFVMVALEWVGVAVFVPAILSIVVDVASGAGNMGPWAMALVVPLLLGCIAADLFTGFLHFFADNFYSVDTPIIGPAFVFRFRQHHEQPSIICQLSFRELNGPAMMLAMPILIPVALLVPVATTTWGLVLGTFVASMMFFGGFTNQIHRWAHAPGRVSSVVRMAQRFRLVLSPAHHRAHHRAPHDVHFGITNGWLDGLLDRYRMWHRLADLMVRMGMPRAEDSVMGARAPAPAPPQDRSATAA
jgi:plasmanylethanolamine desaturase